MKKDEILKAELIGKHVKVVDAENKGLIGIEGTIVDETRNTLKVETNNGEKTLVKDQVTITMEHKGNTFEVNGKLLVNRPEERIKKVRSLK